MTLERYNHPKYMLIHVYADGQDFLLRHETDSWRVDPLAGFKERLQSNRMTLFSSDAGGDVWLRPSSISAFIASPWPLDPDR